MTVFFLRAPVKVLLTHSGKVNFVPDGRPTPEIISLRSLKVKYGFYCATSLNTSPEIAVTYSSPASSSANEVMA